MSSVCYYGDAGFLVEEAAREFEAAYSGSESSPGFEKELYTEQRSLSELNQLLSSGSLFASQFLVVMKEPWFLFRAPSESELGELKRLFETVSEAGHAVVMSCVGKKPDMRKKAVKTLKEWVQFQEFKPFSDWEQDKLQGWISSRFSKAGKSVGREVTERIALLSANRLEDSAQLISAVLSYVGEKAVSLDDVMAVSGPHQFSLFQCMDAMKCRDLPGLLAAVNGLIQSGEEPLGILAMLAGQSRLYIQILALCASGHSNAEMAKALGKHPYFIEKLTGEIRRAYTLDVLLGFHSTLSEMDMVIKTGAVAGPKALSLAVLALK